MRNTSQTHPERNEIEDAMAKIEKVVETVNERTRKVENLVQLREIQENIDDPEGLLR